LKSLLIIGGLGLLGNRLVQKAKGKFDVAFTYRSGEPWHDAKGHQLDITDFQATNFLIKELQPDAVINTAAFHVVDGCEKDKNLAKLVNTDAAINLGRACQKAGSHYIFVSTDYVFDGSKKEKYSVSDVPNPQSYYGESKLLAESSLLSMDADNAVARTSVIYGWNPKKNFITWLIGELKAGKEVKIVDDQFSSPTLADNGADALLRMVELEKTGVWHVAGKDCLSRYVLAQKTAKVFGFDESLIRPIKTSELNQLAKRPANSCLDVGKTEKELGVRMLSCDQGLMLMAKQEKKLREPWRCL